MPFDSGLLMPRLHQARGNSAGHLSENGRLAAESRTAAGAGRAARLASLPEAPPQAAGRPKLSSPPTQPAGPARTRSCCGRAREQPSFAHDVLSTERPGLEPWDDCRSGPPRQRGGSVAKLHSGDSLPGRDPSAGTPCCLCFPGQLRYSLFICLADAGSSHTAYFISVLITFLIVLSCITFSLETLPVFRVASEVNKEPYIVFELIERIAIAVFTVEYVLRLLTYSAVPREEDADSKLLLFEARMLERRAEAASRRDGTYSDGKYDGSSDDDDMDGAFASQAGSDGRGVPVGARGMASRPPSAAGMRRRSAAGRSAQVAAAARIVNGAPAAVAGLNARRPSLAQSGSSWARQRGGGGAARQAQAGPVPGSAVRPAANTPGSAGFAREAGGAAGSASTGREGSREGQSRPPSLALRNGEDRRHGVPRLGTAVAAAGKQHRPFACDPAADGKRVRVPSDLQPGLRPSSDASPEAAPGSAGPAPAITTVLRGPSSPDVTAFEAFSGVDRPGGTALRLPPVLPRTRAEPHPESPGSFRQVGASAAAAAAGGAPARPRQGSSGSSGSGRCSPPDAGAAPRSGNRQGSHVTPSGSSSARHPGMEALAATASEGRRASDRPAAVGNGALERLVASEAVIPTTPTERQQQARTAARARLRAAGGDGRAADDVSGDADGSASVALRSFGGGAASAMEAPSPGSGVPTPAEDRHGLRGSGAMRPMPLVLQFGQDAPGVGREGGAPAPTGDPHSAVAAAMADGASSGKGGASWPGSAESRPRWAGGGVVGNGNSDRRGGGGADGANTASPARAARTSILSNMEADGGDELGSLRFVPTAAASSAAAAAAAAVGLSPGDVSSSDSPSVGFPPYDMFKAPSTTRAAQRVSVASDSDSRQAVPGSAPGRTGGAKTGPRAHFSSWTGPSKTGAGVGGSGGAAEGGSPQRKASGKDGLSKTTSGNDLHRANLGLGRSKRRLVQVIGDPSLDPVASGRTARYIKPSKSVRMLSGVMQPGQITEFQRLRLHSNADGAAVTPDGARHRAASSSSRDESGTAHLRSGSRDEGGLGLSIEPRSAVYGGAKAPFSGAAAPQHTAAGAASGLASPGAGASGQEATGGIIARRRASAKVAPAEQISGSSELVQHGGDGGSGSPRMHHLVAFGSSQQPRPRDRGLCQPCRRFCSSVGLLPPGENEGVFESSWSLDEQATKEEARQLADLRSKAASNTCCRRAASELHRVWQFVLAPLNIVDLLAIVPFYIELFAAGSGGVGLTVFRILRLGRVFRIFKLGKSSATLQLMAKVMVASVDALSIIIFFIAIGVILFGALIWIAEGGEYDEAEGAFLRLNEFGTGRERTPFDSIPATAWFVIVTLTTLGYGDQVPTSTLGRFIAGLLALVGILVLALPVTILGANFAYYYSQDEKEKQEAERERFRAQEGFEDDLSDVYSQAGALDELALPGPDRFDADDHDHDDDDDEAEKDPAAFARSMSMHDDVPRWEQRKAAFVPVQAGGYSPALRCFVYNPFVKDDVFADGIAESLAAEVDDRVADLRRDAAQREAIAARRWQRRVEREARREGALEAPASPGRPGSRPGPAGAGRRRAASNERDRAGSGWDATGAQQHGGPEAALALRDRSPSWAEAGELAEALSSRVVRRRSAAAQARKHRRLSSARPGVPVSGAKTMAGLGQKGGPAAQATGEAGAHGGPLTGGNRRLSAGAVMTHRPSSSGEGGNESLRLGTQDAAELVRQARAAAARRSKGGGAGRGASGGRLRDKLRAAARAAMASNAFGRALKRRKDSQGTADEGEDEHEEAVTLLGAVLAAAKAQGGTAQPRETATLHTSRSASPRAGAPSPPPRATPPARSPGSDRPGARRHRLGAAPVGIMSLPVDGGDDGARDGPRDGRGSPGAQSDSGAMPSRGASGGGRRAPPGRPLLGTQPRSSPKPISALPQSYGRDRPRGAGPPPDESHDSGTTRDIFAKLTEARQHREAGPRSRTFAKGLGELAPDGPADWHSGRVHGPAGAAAAMRGAGGAGLGSGGQSTASVGGNMGVSWQLRQVVKQVTRAIRADGTAEAITSVRLEQAELRAALDDTRAGLATALAELRSVTDVLRDQRAVAASSVDRRRSSASVGDTAMQLRQRLTADELRQLVSELSHQAPRE